MKFLSLILLATSIIAHSNIPSHNGDEYEPAGSGGSMYNTPIFINFDGSVTYSIGLMDHSGHTGNGGMDSGHGSMDGGMDSGHGSMDGGMDSGHGSMDGGMDSGHGSMDGGMDSGHGDMDHGGMDHGGMNHGSKIAWHIMPMVHIGGDANHRVVSLSKNDALDFELQRADKSGKFLSIRNRRIEAGLGLMVMGMPTQINWGGFFQLGFMPFKGSFYFSKRLANSYEEAKSSKYLKIPNSEEELSSWSEGDKVIFTTGGGVMMGAGIGATIFTDLSINYMTSGTWRVTVEKTKNSKVKVGVTEMKLSHVMTNMGATVVSTNIGRHKLKSISLDFEFDLSKTDGLSSYLSLLNGDMRFAEELISGNLEGVRSLNRVSSIDRGVMRQTHLGVPLIFKRNKMKMTSVSNTESLNLENEQRVDTKMTMVHLEKNTEGKLSKHLKEYIMYMGTEVNLVNQDFKYNDGAFIFFYERDVADSKKLNKVIKRWSKFLGESAYKTLKSNSKEFGYSRLSHSVVLTAKALDYLKKESKGNVKSFMKKALKSSKKFNSLFSNLKDLGVSQQVEFKSERYKTLSLSI